MRTYAAFYNSLTSKWSIIFQDDYEYDVWYIHMHEMSEDGGDVKQIVRSLNKDEERNN